MRAPGWRRGRCPQQALPVLADPELIHAGKHPRIFGLEILTQAEIPARIRLRNWRAETVNGVGISDEAEKFDLVLTDEIRDLGQRQLMLLHMEEHVAALADGEEVEMPGDLARGLSFRQLQNILAAAPDILRGCSVSAPGNEGAGGVDVLAAEPAVKPEPHEAAGTQQREQDLPAGPRVGHVMKDTARVHDVYDDADTTELENVGLAEGDVGQSQSQRLPLGVAEARQAEIDGQHQRAFEVSRRLDQILPGSAARNEDVDPVVPTQFRP